MLEEIYNFMRMSEKLASGGMPTAGQLQDAAKQGVETVINLAPHEAPNALPGEEELVRSLGMEYINIPVVWSASMEQNLNTFMDAMDRLHDKHVLVHCQANYRVSAFIMLYRVLRLGWNKADAIPVMEKMWNPEDFPVWQKFIDEQLVDHG
jgi:protein tyrosine phosphatase (PTP) superfamily phosphohydrolase (DUF442 family)